MATRAAKKREARVKRTDPAPVPVERVPAWVPPLVYALVCLILFRETVIGAATILGVDTMALSYFARSFFTQVVHTTGAFPLWNPLLFGGMPFIDGMHGDIFYPPSLALLWMAPQVFWGWKMVLHVFLAGVFAYVWLRGIGLRRGPAFFGGLTYMLGADLVSLTFPGGDGKLFVSALAPLVFWLADRAANSGQLGDFAFFGLGIASIVFTSHMQLAYFCVWGVSLYFGFRVVQRWRADRDGRRLARVAGLFVLAGLLGVGAAAIQFFPPLGYLREWSHRVDRTVTADPAEAYAYSTSFSLHPEEIAALVVPEFVGDNVPSTRSGGNTYWGRNPFKLNHEYAGFIPLLLIPVLFVGRRDPRAWFFVVLGALSLLYALGATTPAFRLFYLIPGVRLFRAPSLIIFLYGLSVATLGAMALQRLIDAVRDTTTDGRDTQTGVRQVLWGTVGVLVLLAALASSGVLLSIWQSVLYRGITPAKAAALEANMPHIRLGFWLVTVLAALVAGTWELWMRRRIRATHVLIVLCVLTGLDLYRVSRPFVDATVFMNRTADPALFSPDGAIRFLQERRDAGEVFRVFDLGTFLDFGPAYPHNTLAVHGIEQLAGHHGNEIGRYRTLIGGEQATNALTSEFRLLNLLNVAYVVSPQRLQMPGLEEVYVSNRASIYRNTNVLPRAYVVGSYEVVPPEAMVERLLSPEFEPLRTVLLEEAPPPGAEPAREVNAEVAWVERSYDELTMRARTDGPGILVLTDNYYPAWRAYVNGQETPVLRANYAFRAVPIPSAGEHEVRFVYDAGYLTTPALVSAGVLLLLTSVGVAGLLRGQGRSSNQAGGNHAAGGAGEGRAEGT